MLQPVLGASAQPSHLEYASRQKAGFTSRELLQAPVLLGNVEFVVLSLLQQDSRYGLELLLAVQQLQRQLAGQLAFSAGRLYPVLSALEEAGLVRREPRPLPGSSARRVFYVLTHQGQAALDAA